MHLVTPGRRAQAKRLALMAVVAVLLATVVAASIGDDHVRPESDYPHASFTFSVENSTVVVELAAGDALDGSNVYVESGTRGRLGNFAGTDGLACSSAVTRVTIGSTCRIPAAADEQLYVVWDGPDNRTLFLGDRDPVAVSPVTSTTTLTTSTPEIGGTPTPEDPETPSAAGETADETTTGTSTTAPPTSGETTDPDTSSTSTSTPTLTGTPTATAPGPSGTETGTDATNSTNTTDSTDPTDS